MRIWISRGLNTPIHEQLASQLLLAILSGDLAPGDRLPSVRQLSRRLKIHFNTVSSVYSDLARRGWAKARPGSGMFVTERPPLPTISALPIAVPSEALVIDPDRELARILAAELTLAEGRGFGWAGCDETTLALAAGREIWVNPGHAVDVSRLLGDVHFRMVAMRSLEDLLAGMRRPKQAVLIGIVSRSPSVRYWARSMLAALGFGEDAVLTRDPAEMGWTQGLQLCHVLAADIVAAAELPPALSPLQFRLLARTKVSQSGGDEG